MIFDIRDYGAVGDASTLNTRAIQAAIDACHEAGGGRVLVSGGTYKFGSIRLKSNVDLHLAADGVLFGSERCEDFPEPEQMSHVNRVMLPRERGASMIFAEEAENISLSGMGRIDCNGKSFVVKREPTYKGWGYTRIDAPTPPRVVFFTGCKNVRISDITMTNQPAGWSYWIHDCDYVSFDRCKIYAEVDYPNNDGIHINASRNVTVSNCDITCGDDCLVIRANNSSLKENKVCEKVCATNCNLTSWSGGIRVGWINDGVIRNCSFSNLVMTDTSVGISLLLPGRGEKRLPDEGRQATLIENISFNNIIMDRNNSNPILIHLYDAECTKIEAVRNLYFSNIHARAGEHPYLLGRKSNIVENIYFNDCSFERVGKVDLCHGAKGVWREFVKEDTGSIKMKFVRNVVMNNTVFSNAEEFGVVELRDKKQ